MPIISAVGLFSFDSRFDNNQNEKVFNIFRMSYLTKPYFKEHFLTSPLDDYCQRFCREWWDFVKLLFLLMSQIDLSHEIRNRPGPVVNHFCLRLPSKMCYVNLSLARLIHLNISKKYIIIYKTHSRKQNLMKICWELLEEWK